MTQRPWQDERWTDSSFIVTTIDPDGTVHWPDGWNAARKRKYLEKCKQDAIALHPDMNLDSGSLKILTQSVQEAEEKERTA